MEIDTPRVWWVECGDCHARGGECLSREKAGEVWNMRESSRPVEGDSDGECRNAS